MCSEHEIQRRYKVQRKNDIGRVGRIEIKTQRERTTRERRKIEDRFYDHAFVRAVVHSASCVAAYSKMKQISLDQSLW